MVVPDLACWLATGLPLALEPSSARGSTIFSATSVSTEKVGSTMKSMKPAAGKGHGVGGDRVCVCVCPPPKTKKGEGAIPQLGDGVGAALTDLRLGHQRGGAVAEGREGQPQLGLFVTLARQEVSPKGSRGATAGPGGDGAGDAGPVPA